MRICLACGRTRDGDGWTCPECGSSPAVIDGFPAFAPDEAIDSSGFDPAYYADLAAVEAQSFWFTGRNALIAWAVGRYFPDCERFLEIGCGTGFVLHGVRTALPAAELSGSEILSAGLGFAQSRVPSATFTQMDARHIPFRDHFDVIGAFDVLEHIEDDTAVIAEVGRALRPGGGLIATVPQHPSLWSPQDVAAHHVRRYTAAGIRRRLAAAGFEVVRTTSFVSLLLPMMVASRASMRLRPGDDTFDAIDTIRQPRIVDAVLGSVMGVERAAIRAGVSFPAGGSLLLVARRSGGVA